MHKYYNSYTDVILKVVILQFTNLKLEMVCKLIDYILNG